MNSQCNESVEGLRAFADHLEAHGGVLPVSITLFGKNDRPHDELAAFLAGADDFTVDVSAHHEIVGRKFGGILVRLYLAPGTVTLERQTISTERVPLSPEEIRSLVLGGAS